MVAARRFAVEVVTKLRSAGYDALWAGGCVRDQLLNRPPKDYDVATSALPDQIREVFGHRRTLAIGASFGVITVLGPRHAGQIEVATFRRDEGYSDGRHPDRVSFSSAKEDALRRDFTINGLFFDPIDEQVIDYVGGQVDLRNKLVRCIGDPNQRFAEDKLRLLRAVRFACTFGFSVHAETMTAAQRHADEIRLVSAERIAAEMQRVLCHQQRATGLKLLQTAGLLPAVLPEHAEQLPTDPTAWKAALSICDRLSSDSFSIAIAAMLLPLCQLDPSATSTIVESLAARWRLPNQQRDQARWMLTQLPVVQRAGEVGWPTLQRVLIHPFVEGLLTLAEAVAPQSSVLSEHVAFCREKLALPADVVNPPPLIDGNDLKVAGIPSGRHFKHLLDQVRDAQLMGQISTKDEAMQLATQTWHAMHSNS